MRLWFFIWVVIASASAGAIILSIWVEAVARLVSALPDVVRLRLMEAIEKAQRNGSSVAKRVLTKMYETYSFCICCGNTCNNEELNFGRYHRCGHCAVWGRTPLMTLAERDEVDAAESEYNRIFAEKGVDAANAWLAKKN